MKPQRTWVLTSALLVGACSSATIEQPSELAFSRSLIARVSAEPASSTTSKPVAAIADPEETVRPAPLPARTREDEWRGLIDIPASRLDELEGAVASDEALAAMLANPLGPGDVAVLAVLRSPAVRKARADYEAARTAYAQSRDLGDLVGLYRSFTRDTATRVGPERSRRSTEMIAPAPNVNGISAEVAKRTADMAFETLRATTRDVVARAWKAHADAARLHEARRIVREEVELDQVLLDVLRARLESGSGSQAGLLAFQARVERLRTELGILDHRETVVRAQWNQLVSRPEAAPVALDVAPEAPVGIPARESESSVIEQALRERQELRVARLAAERAGLGVRLAETMTLPRMDLGSSRFERERAGEAGVQRGVDFPQPGRMIMPRWDFGVREAQVQEMRSRAESMSAASDGLRDAVRTETRTALFEVDAAGRRVLVHEQEVVPASRSSLDAARGAYEGNRTGYLDLLDAVRRLLDARLGLADERRNLVRAQASLLRAVGVRITEER